MSTGLVGQTPMDIQLYKELVKEVTSPLNLDNLNEVITLIPCAHKVQSIVFKDRERKTCPECRSPVSRCLTQDRVMKILDNLSQMSEGFKVKRGFISDEIKPRVNRK